MHGNKMDLGTFMFRSWDPIVVPTRRCPCPGHTQLPALRWPFCWAVGSGAQSRPSPASEGPSRVCTVCLSHRAPWLGLFNPQVHKTVAVACRASPPPKKHASLLGAKGRQTSAGLASCQCLLGAETSRTPRPGGTCGRRRTISFFLHFGVTCRCQSTQASPEQRTKECTHATRAESKNHEDLCWLQTWV